MGVGKGRLAPEPREELPAITGGERESGTLLKWRTKILRREASEVGLVYGKYTQPHQINWDRGERDGARGVREGGGRHHGVCVGCKHGKQ